MRVFLKTERLVLRRFTGADADDLFALDGDPKVMRFLNGGRPRSRGVLGNEPLPGFIRSYEGFGVWAAVERSTGVFLGWFAFFPPEAENRGEVELGYRLRRSAWGKGYATEGCRALIRQGFTEPGVERVADTMTVNAASRRVMEKAGRTFVRTFHQRWPGGDIEGSEHGDVEYALTKADWKRREMDQNERARRPE